MPHQQEAAVGIVPKLTKLAECLTWCHVFSQELFTLPTTGLPHNLMMQSLCEQIQRTHALREVLLNVDNSTH